MKAIDSTITFDGKSVRRFQVLMTVLACLTAGNTDAQSWNYRINAVGLPGGSTYRQANDPMGNGYVTLEEKDGKAIFRMAGVVLIKCYQGDLDALVTRTAETT